MFGTFGHSNTFAILTAFTAIPTQRKETIGSFRELISHGISHMGNWVNGSQCLRILDPGIRELAGPSWTILFTCSPDNIRLH